MDFSLDLPWPWSLSPVELLQMLTGGLLPSFLGRLLVGGIVGLAIGLATRRGNPFAGIPTIVMAALGWLLAGQPLPLLAAVFVVYLTVATYRGPAGARRSVPRLAVVLALRLFALFLTMLTIARPALVVRTEDKVPSLLLLVLDRSESMTIKDEYNNQTRFEAMRATLERCRPIIKQLQDENQITTKILAFADTVRDWDDDARPDGKSSDYGLALAEAYQRFGSEANLRGLLLVGDGADNGRRYNAQLEARRWKAIQCPINGFALGSTTTNRDQKDLAITSLTVEPAPVFVKGRMTLKAMVNAAGYENAVIEPRVFIDGKEGSFEKIVVNGEDAGTDPKLPLTADNELHLEMSAPETPGEIRVTLKIKPLPGEAIASNNEISTYVTVAKEGVSVLLVAPLDEETKYIRQVLTSDPRVRLFETTRQTNDAPRGDEAGLFNFDRQNYDVIILRNVSARRLSGGDPKVLDRIADLVTKKGTGLMMMGGFDSFGGTPDLPGSGDWKGTPIEALLPVELNVAGHVERDRIEFHPTDAGAAHYLLQLDADPGKSLKIWNRLNEEIWFRGVNRLGTPKPGATLLATAETNSPEVPLLVAQSVGRGRTLAFAADSTNLWRMFGLPDTTEGIDIHARFWKQTALWLAHQENAEGSVWVKPDFRRLAAGAQQGFTVGVRGKSGLDLPGGRYEVRVVAPDGSSFPVPVRREAQSDRGQFWQTLKPGEYRLEVTGSAPDADQKRVDGKASVRFLVYQDDREMLMQAADPDFLGKVAAVAGGRANPYRIDDLPDFLARLKGASLPSEKVKVERYPDWRSMKLTPFLPMWLLLFVTVLCAEWALRRLWGMV